MQFLSNFNTTLDQDKIHEKSIVVKHYPMYVVSWGKIGLYLMFFSVLIIFTYYQQIIFGNIIGSIFNFIYLILIIIWVFYHAKFLYNYIKNFKTYYDVSTKYILTEQDFLYDKALKISLFLLLFNIILSFFSGAYGYFNSHIPVLDLSIFFISNISLIVLQWSIIKKSLIDFEMNFMVIDGKLGEIAIISQSGFLSISSETASFSLISAVNSNSEGLMRSWLNYGYIDIITMSNEPNISIKYIKNPGQIETIIKMAKSVYSGEDNNLKGTNDFIN